MIASCSSAIVRKAGVVAMMLAATLSVVPESLAQQVATPTSSLDAFPIRAREVYTTLGVSTSSASIRLTTDGTSPVSGDTEVPGGTQLLLDRPLTLSLRGVKAGMTDSAIVEFTYIVAGMVAGGDSHTLALRTDGQVVATGRGNSGQLGRGNTTSLDDFTPVTALSNVSAISAGRDGSVSLLANGQVWSWGSNGKGEVGDNTTNQRNSPVQVQIPTSAVAVSAGDRFKLAVTADGKAWAWGSNGSGNLGDGSTTNRSAPVRWGSATDIISVSAGGTHALALRSGGGVYSCGNNGQGRLGDGSTTQRKSPVSVQGITNAVMVAAGETHSLVLTATGQVYAFGDNSSGQLGDGTTTDRSTPVLVSSLSGIVWIGGFGFSSVALDNQGRVYTWGDNWVGQLGNGNTNDRSTPAQVTGLPPIAAVGKGTNSLHAVAEDGRVYAWGYNNEGQLGDGTLANRSTPTLLTGFTIIAAYEDPDGDGLLTWQERELGFNPNDTYSQDPVNATDDGDWDSDGDQVSNIQELVAATDPLDYYNHVQPSLSVTPASQVMGPSAAALFTASVELGANPNPTNAPLAIAVLSGEGTITGLPAVPRTNAAGEYAFAVTAGTTPSNVTQISVSAGTAMPKVVSVTVVSEPVQELAWHMDEGTGTSIAEEGGTGIGGTASPAASWINGPDGTKGLGFSGSSGEGGIQDRVAFGSPLDGSLDFGTANMTMMLWLKFSNVSVARTILAKGSSETAPGYYLATHGNGRIGFGMGTTVAGDATKALAFETLGEFDDGQWHHVAVILNRAASTAQLLIDGTPAPLQMRAGSSGTIGGSGGTVCNYSALTNLSGAAGGASMYLGARDGSSGWYLGQVDELRMCRSALTEAEARAAMNRDLEDNGNGTFGDGLPDWWESLYWPGALASTEHGAGDDADGDGTSNLDEFLAGTNPLDFYNGVVPVLKSLSSNPVVSRPGEFVEIRIEVGDGVSPMASAPVTFSSAEARLSLTDGGSTLEDSLTVSDPSGNVVVYVKQPDEPYAATQVVATAGAASIELSAWTLNPQGTLSSGSTHTLAVDGFGRVWAWGDNSQGELGDGTSRVRWIPRLVAGLDNAIGVAAGYHHSLAVKSDGTVWAWGLNSSGQLGTEDTISSSVPVEVPDLEGIVLVAAGHGYSLALDSQGRVWAWGGDSDGVLGNGAGGASSVPALVSGLSGVVITDIAAGYAHALALDEDGQIWAWGNNGAGQLGNGTYSMYGEQAPVLLSSISGVADISAGTYHSVALKSDGTVWAWGSNSFGQVGDGTTNMRTTPVAVGTSFGGVVSISAGGDHTLAVKGDGSLWGWGQNWYGQAGAPQVQSTVLSPAQVAGIAGAVVASAGSLQSAVIVDDGSITAFGNGEYGVLGNGQNLTQYAPVLASKYVFPEQVGRPIFSARSGPYLSAFALEIDPPAEEATIRYTLDGTAVGPDSAVLASGDDIQIQATTTVRARAFQNGLAASLETSATYVIGPILSCGDSHVLLVDSGGKVWAWGENDQSRLGDGTTFDAWNPEAVEGLADVTGVSAGYQHSLAVRADGTVWVWGQNSSGQLGTGDSDPRTTPWQLSSLSEVVSVAAGQLYSLALDAQGTVWAWGSDANGTLGNGPASDSNVPVEVTGLEGVNIVAIAAGAYHALALDEGGNVWVWGSNDSGKLGYGSTVSASIHFPILLGTMGDVVAIDAGYSHTLALKSDETVWSWGDNSYGQLGFNSAAYSSGSPVRAGATLSSVVALGAGANHSVAVKSDGSLRAWGANGEGQLALNPTATPKLLAPTEVLGVDNVILAGGGLAYSIAVLADTYGNGLLHSLLSWGANGSGQLGDSTRGTGVLPTPGMVRFSWDYDGDGSFDWDEIQSLGTDPTLSDTNSDGLGDWVSLMVGIDPLSLDSDGDGLTNAVEVALGTSAILVDSDWDGVNDAHDAFPTDPSRSEILPGAPGDVTPPIVSVLEPSDATLVGSAPPLP